MIWFADITWQERQERIKEARARIEKAEAKRRDNKRERDAKAEAKRQALRDAKKQAKKS